MGRERQSFEIGRHQALAAQPAEARPGLKQHLLGDIHGDDSRAWIVPREAGNAPAGSTADIDDRLLPNFHYDDIFGTVVNRFVVQAVAGVPLTVYGKGGQIRGYLNLLDTLACVRLAMENPADQGQLRILNQFTEQFTVLELADRVQQAAKSLGIAVKIDSLPNPRKELEEHYYNPAHSGLLELGLQPHIMTEAVVARMLQQVLERKDRINADIILPRVRWRT